jgi:hypothetical protein
MFARSVLLSVLSLLVLALRAPCAAADIAPADFPALFATAVPHHYLPPAEEVAIYRQALTEAMHGVNLVPANQFVVLVDRNPEAQVLLLFMGAGPDALFIGAVPVTTGNVGRSDYYITPRGVFDHSLLTDFRAQGTYNDHGVRGYGEKGMRIWDMGWQRATKGWGQRFVQGETGEIRMQLHATDPEFLEPHLGQRGSKGCIRIPAAVNQFFDRYGVLDAAYDVQAKQGRKPGIWGKDHIQTPFSGRYVVVIDSADHPVGL